jgi:D-inositol-3-phosphate glycosyltransferase
VEHDYHAADLLFHPALFETFGLVVMEAAACGTPVLTSAAVGATELFTGPGALAVATRPEPALFAPLLERLVTEPEFARDVAGSQQRAVAPRTWPAYAAEFMAATAALLPAGSGA